MLHQIAVLIDRGRPLERAGQWQDAIGLYEEAFQRGISHSDNDAITESVLRIGYLYRHLGQVEIAQEYLELGFTLAQLAADGARMAQAKNGLGTLLHVQGGINEAERLYTDARNMSVAVGDDLTLGHVELNLGTLATIRGELPDALAHFRSALDAYERVGHDRGTAGVLNNLGMLYIDLNRLGDAADALDRSLAMCRRIGDIVTESIVHSNRTELFLALHDLPSARTSCDEAFEISSRLGDNRTKADALKFSGVIYRESGKPHLAEVHLRQAIGIASKYGDPLTEAEARRELALVLRAQDRNKESLQELNRAHVLFTSLQAKHEQADIDKRLNQLEDDFLALVQVWGESIEAKDRYTSGHCERVAEYACSIAERAGITERDMVWFRMGAFLHDVGKTDIPGEILNKPGRLTDEERATMERHTVIGDELLAPIPFPWDIRPMVRSHHERWDGRGYPDGLRGEEIHLTARILRFADIFDALTTTRSYREPLSPEQALQIMRDDHGSFDPALFAIFEELFPEFAARVPAISE